MVLCRRTFHTTKKKKGTRHVQYSCNFFLLAKFVKFGAPCIILNGRRFLQGLSLYIPLYKCHINLQSHVVNMSAHINKEHWLKKMEKSSHHLIQMTELKWEIVAEVGCNKTVISNCLKDPEGYGTNNSSSRPKKISPALSRKIRQVEDTG